MAFSESIAALGINSPWDDLIIAMAGDASTAALVKGVIATESQWNMNAINPSDPSYGLMQILAGARGPYPSVTPANLMEPSTNITLGVTYLISQIRRFGMPGGVAAYNSGTPRTLPGGQYVNQAYVDSVLSYQSWYLGQAPVTVSGGSNPPYDAALTVGAYWPYDPATADSPLGTTSMDPLADPMQPTSPLSSPTFDLSLAIGLGILVIGAVYMGSKR